MTKTLTRLFDTYAQAESAVRDLEAIGVPHSDMSIVANDAAGTHGRTLTGHNDVGDRAAAVGEDTAHAVGHADADGDVSRGATTGALLGGAGGLLAGLGLLAIPGLGPVVAAGWLLATAAGAGVGAAGGAATGGIVGALKNSGHTDEEAHVYSEGVRRGGTLVSARVSDDLAETATEVLGRYHGSDAASRGAAYRADGWSAYDDKAPAYSVVEADAERSRYSSRM